MKNNALKIGAILGVGALMLTTSCKKEVEPAIGSDKTTAAIGEAIKFSDTQVEERNNVSFRWDFGDGTESSDRNPSHVYEKAGEYTVTQTVYLNKNANKGKFVQKSAELKITVEGPTAAFTTDKTAYAVGEGIMLKNTSTVNDKGYPINYEWSYANSNGTTSHIASTKSPSTKFMDAGTYTITLKVSQGMTVSEKSVEITVGGATPSTANAAVKAMIVGEWKGGTTSESVVISGGAGTGDCPANTSFNEPNYITKAVFYSNGEARVIRLTGDQTSGTVFNWNLSADGKFITLMGAGIGGTFEVTATASALTFKSVEIVNCNAGTWSAPVPSTYTETATLALTK